MPLLRVFIWISHIMVIVTGDREFFIAAAEEFWDYMPPGGDTVTTRLKTSIPSVDMKTVKAASNSVFKKAIYREYTDASFTVEKPKPDWLGFVGPVLYGEVEEFIRVTFYNNASRKYSMHPHGILYNKPNEGALYADGTHDNASQPALDLVEPGDKYTYVWNVVHDAAPSDGDPDCLTWAYHSHIDTEKDTNSGLVGIILTCRKGALNVTDLRRHYALYVTTVDETKSWYAADNMVHDSSQRVNTSFHVINGYSYRNLPNIEACVGETITWHMMALGSTKDMHSLSINGHSFDVFHHRQSSLSLNTAEFVTATTTALAPGRWLISCNVFEHAEKGMQAIFHVRQCDTLRYRSHHIRNIRRYYIAAEEVFWNYGPSGENKIDGISLTNPGSDSEKYFKKSNSSIGGIYKKAVFREYEDYRFKSRKYDHKQHYGILGPVIRAEVGELIQITFKNMASRPYSLHGEGVELSKKSEGSQYNDDSKDTRDNSVPPGQMYTYYWFIPKEVGPTHTDPQCLTRVYTSGVEVTRDMYSGLIGPLLVCKPGRLNRQGKQINTDREFILLLSVTDENKSWYIDDNIQRAGLDKDIKGDNSFTESNLMHGINGLMYGNLEGLNMCAGDRVSWHVLSVGTTSDLHSLYFHGNTFSRVHTHRSTTALLPGVRKTLYMTPECSGTWMLSCQTDNHYTAGEKALYKVNRCGSDHDVKDGGSAGTQRVFYIQAEEQLWDYAPSGKDMINDKDLPGTYAFKTYWKVLYRGYTDESFKTRLNQTGQEHLGMLGPLIRIEVGETLKVVFRNTATRPFSFHPQGLTYRSSGPSDADRHKSDEPSVPPGETFTYTWNVRKASGPGKADPNCINYPYYSDVDPLRDVNTGLAGALVICRPGTLDDNERKDIGKDFAIYFTIIDEGISWLVDKNTQSCRKEFGIHGLRTASCSPNKFYAINGYIFGNQPVPTMQQWTLVDWYLMTLGDQGDLHPVHFHGNDVHLYDGQVRTNDVSQLFPGVFSTVRMHAINPGKWLFHCHVNFHISKGMEGMYYVDKRIIPLNITTDLP